MTSFKSTFCWRGTAELPNFTGTRVMMLPLVLGDESSIPDFIKHYASTLTQLFGLAGHKGAVGYLTVDERKLLPGQTLRRPQPHVDGVYHGRMGAWGGGGGWGSVGNGMLVVSNPGACRAWSGDFQGTPGDEGECEHLQNQLSQDEHTDLGSNQIYWLDGLCVHESLPVPVEMDRQFVRLSLPNNGPWFEGYTENPLGVIPTGPILPRREFLNA